MLYVVRVVCCAALIACALSASISAQSVVSLSANEVVIDRPSINRWQLNLGGEFPGAVGRIAMTSSIVGSSPQSLQAHYDFTHGGKYIGVLRSLTLPADVQSIGLRVKVDQPTSFMIRLIDSTGQSHQASLGSATPGDWQMLAFTLSKGFLAHWSGANDGVVHFPVTGVWINIENTGIRQGSVCFDTLTVTADREPAPAIDTRSCTAKLSNGLIVRMTPEVNRYTANTLHAVIENASGEPFDGKISLITPEAWGQQPCMPIACTMAAGRATSLDWEFANAFGNPCNAYVVRLRIESASTAIEQTFTFNGTASASVNYGQPRTSSQIGRSTFGTLLHLYETDYVRKLELTEAAGFTWIRDAPEWGGMERQKGHIDMPKWYNDAVTLATQKGIQVICPLFFGNELYPYKDFDEFRRGYTNFCRFMVRHLKDRVRIYEIWNEPAGFHIRAAYGGTWNATEGKQCPWVVKFTDLVISAAKAIREEDPQAIIITNIDVPATYHFLDLMQEKNAIGLLDGLAIHPYAFRLPPETLPWGGKEMRLRDGIAVADDDHSYASLLRRLRAKMRQVGMKTTDLYVTEFGYTTFHRTHDSLYEGFTPETQAEYLCRQFILHKVHGIKAAIQYDLRDDGDDPENAEHRFGLVRTDWSPKPSYFAVQRVCSLLSDPVTLFSPTWKTEIVPDRYFGSDKWKLYEPAVSWEGSLCKSLGFVQKYFFRNGDGEIMLVVWNALRATNERQPLLADIVLHTTSYSRPLAIDLLTGERYDLPATIDGGKTILRKVQIPTHPIVIKLFATK